MDNQAAELIQEYIHAHNVMVLSTCAGDAPWSTPLFYASRGWHIYFLSNPATRHCQLLAAQPQVSLGITEPYTDWRQIRGVQAEGTCRPLMGTMERAAAMAVYFTRFPMLSAVTSAGGALAAEFAKARFYEIHIQRAWMTDNPAGFGSRWHVDLIADIP